MKFSERFSFVYQEDDPRIDYDCKGRLVRIGDFYEPDPGRRPRLSDDVTAIIFDRCPTDEERLQIREALGLLPKAAPEASIEPRGFNPDWWL